MVVLGRYLLIVLLALSATRPLLADEGTALRTEKAQDAEARTAFADGLTALRASDWPLAEQHFRRSLELVPRPSARYNLALVLFMQNRAEESLAVLGDLLASHDATEQNYREYAETLAARIRAKTAAAQPKPEAPPAPASVPPAKPARGEKRATASPAPPPAAAPKGKPAPADSRSGIEVWGPWAAIGTGGALLIVGSVTGILALRADQRYVDGCPSLRCKPEPSLVEAHDDAIRYGHITNVLLASGAAFVAGGVVWRVVLPRPDARSPTQASPLVVTMAARF
jgi:hypothetical protein